MTLGNMRELGVHHLLALCLNEKTQNFRPGRLIFSISCTLKQCLVTKRNSWPCCTILLSGIWRSSQHWVIHAALSRV
jgi:hypothetical protein